MSTSTAEEQSTAEEHEPSDLNLTELLDDIDFDGDLDLDQLESYLFDGGAPPLVGSRGKADDTDRILEAHGAEMGEGLVNMDPLSRRRANNRISARLSRERKRQTLSALEVRLGNLEGVSGLLDEQLMAVLAQNLAMRKDLVALELGYGENSPEADPKRMKLSLDDERTNSPEGRRPLSCGSLSDSFGA